MRWYLSLTSCWGILTWWFHGCPLSRGWGHFQLGWFGKHWNMRANGICDVRWTRPGNDSCCHLPSIFSVTLFGIPLLQCTDYTSPLLTVTTESQCVFPCKQNIWNSTPDPPCWHGCCSSGPQNNRYFLPSSQQCSGLALSGFVNPWCQHKPGSWTQACSCQSTGEVKKVDRSTVRGHGCRRRSTFRGLGNWCHLHSLEINFLMVHLQKYFCKFLCSFFLSVIHLLSLYWRTFACFWWIDRHLRQFPSWLFLKINWLGCFSCFMHFPLCSIVLVLMLMEPRTPDSNHKPDQLLGRMQLSNPVWQLVG